MLDEGKHRSRFQVICFLEGGISWNCRSRVNRDKEISCGIEEFGRGVCVEDILTGSGEREESVCAAEF